MTSFAGYGYFSYSNQNQAFAYSDEAQKAAKENLCTVFFQKKGGIEMDERAIQFVLSYVAEHLDKSDPEPDFDVFIVWKCKTLQNWKYLISTTLYDGMYYELTYNGDKREWYLDAYKKFDNRRIPEGAE